MPKVLKTVLAEADADDIWLHIAHDDPAAADGVIDAIEQQLLMLAENPKAGRLRPDLGVAGLRSYPAGNYILFYRPVADGVELVRLLHGARDLPKEFTVE